MFRILSIALAAFIGISTSAYPQSLDGRLKKIADTKTITIGYRADATPFSFTNDKKEATGFSIDLCKRVVASIERQLNISGLQIKWEPVTVQSRFDAVAKGQVDMECGSSTVTLSRMKQVDFSNYIFVETTGLLVKSASGLRTLTDMGGKRIGVIGGTTNERAVNNQLKKVQVNATVVPFKSRDEAVAALEDSKIDAFASDKLLLLGSLTRAKDPKIYAILNDELSYEPYGIALPRNDSAFRLAVNTGLSQVYSTSQIADIFKLWFGGLGRPTPVIEAVYFMGAVPE